MWPQIAETELITKYCFWRLPSVPELVKSLGKRQTGVLPTFPWKNKLLSKTVYCTQPASLVTCNSHSYILMKLRGGGSGASMCTFLCCFSFKAAVGARGASTTRGSQQQQQPGHRLLLCCFNTPVEKKNHTHTHTPQTASLCKNTPGTFTFPCLSKGKGPSSQAIPICRGKIKKSEKHTYSQVTWVRWYYSSNE